MNRAKPYHFIGLFLAGGLLSLIAGVLVGRPQMPLDLECSGRTAMLLPNGEGRQWLVVRYDLDLRKELGGDFKARLRLLDAASGQDLGYQHRTANFTYQRQGQRLLLTDLHSGGTQTGNLSAEKLAGVGLFVFNEQMRLSFLIRKTGPDSLLVDIGQGGALLCARNAPGS